jgi:hypothetical protein
VRLGKPVLGMARRGFFLTSPNRIARLRLPCWRKILFIDPFGPSANAPQQDVPGSGRGVSEMKDNVFGRFMVFVVEIYHEPSGGLADCTEDFDTLEEAIQSKTFNGHSHYRYIFDRVEGIVVDAPRAKSNF